MLWHFYLVIAKDLGGVQIPGRKPIKDIGFENGEVQFQKLNRSFCQNPSTACTKVLRRRNMINVKTSDCVRPGHCLALNSTHNRQEIWGSLASTVSLFGTPINNVHNLDGLTVKVHQLCSNSSGTWWIGKHEQKRVASAMASGNSDKDNGF
jgi:hypothetical protein